MPSLSARVFPEHSIRRSMSFRSRAVDAVLMVRVAPNFAATARRRRGAEGGAGGEGVVRAGRAGGAARAGGGGFNHDGGARGDPCRRAGGKNYAGALMAEDGGLAQHVGAVASVGEVVHVRAA